MTTIPVLHDRFATADLDELGEFFVRAYDFEVSFPFRGGGDFHQHSLTAGPITLNRGATTLTVDYEVSPFDYVFVAHIDSGSMGREMGSIREDFVEGDWFLWSEPGRPAMIRWRPMHGTSIQLDLGVVYDVARQSTGDEAPAPLRFLGYRPVSPAAAAAWGRTVAFVTDVLERPGAAASPLINGRLARLLAAGVLATFPNTLVSESVTPSAAPASERVLRRAIDYMHAASDADLPLSDIAAAADASTTGIAAAFRWHLDTTPAEYLATLRLRDAYRDLSEGGTGTVSEVAARRGFVDPFDFSRRFRLAYGRSPSSLLLD